VSGYLTKVCFKDGSEVKQGDLLFEIDPRPYQAEYERAAGQVQAAEARLKFATVDYHRAKELVARQAIGQDEIDKRAAALAEAEAQIKVARANLDLPRLNLAFTKITAPITGRTGRSLLSVGNVVQADLTTLTTLVSQAPMYVYFDMDERTVLRLRQLARDGKNNPGNQGQPILLGLAGETGFPHRGTLDFINNKVDPTTGALQARAVFANKDHLLSPGMFVRVRLLVGQPHKAMLVAEQAVFTAGGRQFVCVVNNKNEVVVREVSTGLPHDGLRVIKEGLRADEGVMVTSLGLGLHAGTKVEPRVVPMPEESKEKPKARPVEKP